MKSNRHGDVLRAVREAGADIDVCSPREAQRALDHGFAADQISLTASMLSNRDLDALVAMGIHVNLDSRSALRRYGERVPRGTRIGLRFDPAVEVGYAGARNVSYGNAKFGFAFAAAEEAIAFAEAQGLAVDTVHAHLGWGLQDVAADAFAGVVSQLAAIARRHPGIRTVNVGGGLGAKRREGDSPLPLERWADALRRGFGDLDVAIACEPGTLLVDAAGVLLVEANTVETRGGRTWIGVDAGHNLHVYAAHYALPVRFLSVRDPLGAERSYSVAGNINEAGDVFGHELAIPEVREGDLLALYPAGAYGASMSSDHCLRGGAAEVAIG
jgi:diaminopimelate decarboxylase